MSATTTPGEPFALAEQAAREIAQRSGIERHKAVIILGSGWLEAAEVFGDATFECRTSELAGFAPPTVAGHEGRVRSVVIGNRPTLLLLGRVHLYEGNEPAAVVHPVRAAVLAGASLVVLTNAAGGLDSKMRPGQPVLIRDHLNLTGRSPLAGPPPPAPYGSRFVDLTACYSPRLRALARAVEPELSEGVYGGFVGPQYETPAEVDMVRRLGADLVGMSTVLEAIAARHLGAEVLGCSLVTNLAAGVSPHPLDHAEVLAAGAAAAPRLARLIADVVARA
ncbi:MAG: purine-nucleoside phosphorylase [Actinomycetota bacterium]|nr:purine-nucleoside phosphorylase [Actinomycetota bacterium]